ncbi:MAG: hypothetical protein ACQETD_06245 [Pseudomonadota bacterium]
MFDIADEATLLETPGGQTLRLRFSGPYDGREVTWDATFTTLTEWRHRHPQSEVRQNFIEIPGDHADELIPLTVCLNLPAIDLPTVRKAILMVRQYKRLGPGRHCYGPPLDAC